MGNRSLSDILSTFIIVRWSSPCALLLVNGSRSLFGIIGRLVSSFIITTDLSLCSYYVFNMESTVWKSWTICIRVLISTGRSCTKVRSRAVFRDAWNPFWNALMALVGMGSLILPYSFQNASEYCLRLWSSDCLHWARSTTVTGTCLVVTYLFWNSVVSCAQLWIDPGARVFTKPWLHLEIEFEEKHYTWIPHYQNTAWVSSQRHGCDWLGQWDHHIMISNGCHDRWQEWVCSRSMVQKESDWGYKFQLRFEVSSILSWHYVWLAGV